LVLGSGSLWGLVLAIPVSVFVMEFLGDIEKRKVGRRKNDEKK
jgi:predicted PurR-regulated permease PerM